MQPSSFAFLSYQSADVETYPSFQWGFRCFFVSSMTPSNHCQNVKFLPGRLSWMHTQTQYTKHIYSMLTTLRFTVEMNLNRVCMCQICVCVCVFLHVSVFGRESEAWSSWNMFVLLIFHSLIISNLGEKSWSTSTDIKFSDSRFWEDSVQFKTRADTHRFVWPTLKQHNYTIINAFTPLKN